MDEPVYTPSTVSKLEPTVSITAVPAPVVVSEYHRVAPPVPASRAGSPGSTVAAVLLSVIVPLAPLRVRAPAQSSFVTEMVMGFDGALSGDDPQGFAAVTVMVHVPLVSPTMSQVSGPAVHAQVAGEAMPVVDRA